VPLPALTATHAPTNRVRVRIAWIELSTTATQQQVLALVEYKRSRGADAADGLEHDLDVQAGINALPLGC